jgi:hypothetical protein
VWSGSYWASVYWPGRQWAKVGAPVGVGRYWSSDYWTAWYWGARYWDKKTDTAPFVSTVTTGPSSSASSLLSSVSLDVGSQFVATVQNVVASDIASAINTGIAVASDTEFAVAAPLLVGPTTISTQIACSVDISTVASSGTGFYWSGGYWASRYWAHNYWGTQSTFVSTVTAGIATSVTANVAAAIGPDLVFQVTAGIQTAVATDQVLADPQIVIAAPPPDATGGWGLPPIKRKKKRPVQKAPEEARSVSEPTRAALEPKVKAPAMEQSKIKEDLDAIAERTKQRRKKAKEALLL